MASCKGDKLAIKVGGCFKSNADPDVDAPKECLDPCNRPSDPTTHCPFGGTPRFEHWDYISGNTFVSPRCGEDGTIIICGDNYEKYRAGMRVSVLGVGSYEVVAVLPDGLRIRNTGNAPDGVSFQNGGSLVLTIGNHDGHWNDANCEDYPTATNGDIIVSNVEPENDDCCAQGITRCRCKGVIEQGLGFLKSVLQGGRRIYQWVQNVMDTTLCNEDMPNAETADAIIGKVNNGCGVKLRPTENCQYLKTIDGGVGFGALDICCVPSAEFSLQESTLLQCRDGETTRTNILPALQQYLDNGDIRGPCAYPFQGEIQDTDRVLVCRNGQGATVSYSSSVVAAAMFRGNLLIEPGTYTIVSQKNYVGRMTASPNNPLATYIFDIGTLTLADIVIQVSGGEQYTPSPPNFFENVTPHIHGYYQVGTQLFLSVYVPHYSSSLSGGTPLLNIVVLRL